MRAGPCGPRWWAVLAVALALVAGLPFPGTAAPAAATGEPALALTGVAPPALTPRSELAVAADLTAGAQPVPAGSRVELRLQRSLLATRGAVADWPEQDLDDPVGSLLAVTELPDGLAAGERLAVALRVPAGETGLPEAASRWGPRGISVVLRGPGAVRLAVVRSHVVWYPADPGGADASQVGEPLGVSVVVPVTGTAPDPLTGAPDPQELGPLVATGGRLEAVLTAAARPGAVLALDPSVLETSTRATSGSGPTAPRTTPPTTGTTTSSPGSRGTGDTGDDEPDRTEPDGTVAVDQTWVDQVDAVAREQETLLLGYGDPDVAALAHAGQVRIARAAHARAERVVEDLLDAAVSTEVAWPVGGVADVATLDLLADLGRTAVLLDQSSQPAGPGLSATPDGRGQVLTTEGSMPSLLSDSVLGATLAAVDDEGAAPTAVQRLLAETAVIALERPSTARHVLVTAPRDWAPPGTTGARAVDALASTPWTRPRALRGLVEADPPDVGRAQPTITEDERAAELDAAGLDRVGTGLDLVRGVADAFEDPAAVTAPVELAAVALASSRWRGRDEEWDAQVAELDQRVGAVRDSVHVVQGSTLTQVSRNVRLPVTVQNDSTQQVTVRLDVVPRSSRLVVTGTVDLTVPAGTSAVGYVPVRGVGNGDTSVVVRLLSPSGNELGEPVQTTVLVRADWESWGTAAVGGVAALLLVVGLIRTWRRGPVGRGHDPLREAASS